MLKWNMDYFRMIYIKTSLVEQIKRISDVEENVSGKSDKVMKSLEF